ncbi:BBE domain-containing protein [Streptomyces roseoverticillatus]|uniref:BBE domain-containing protein n=1 Tax=Streptomyces roseoverticillatus TaxID=66429 RepID=A0ABV3J383_9ACTN
MPQWLICDAVRDRGPDSAYVNYPDGDFGVATAPDPAHSRLYYKGNGARLQEAKKYWDPKNHFHHERPPGGVDC